MPDTLTGLTWDHPRGYDALYAAAQRDAGAISINWQKQPLEGFESHPVGELCARYDLVVLDHPHLGEAIEGDCLVSLEEVFEPDELATLVTGSIGPTAQSYVMNNRHWAVPLDAATQVSAWRSDLLEPSAAGFCWDEVQSLSARTGKVALSLAGPHALLSYFSILAAMGRPADHNREGLFDEQAGRIAYELMVELALRTPRSVIDLNPIGILEHMSSSSDVVMCPLIYGYVNYTNAKKAGQHDIQFSDAPAFTPGGIAGSTLGGTGIAISRRCPITQPLKAHLLWLMSEEAQTNFIPQHAGQPSLKKAWSNPVLNQRWSDFYTATAASVTHAYVRPRYNGYIRFQTTGSALLRESLLSRKPWRNFSAELQALCRTGLSA